MITYSQPQFSRTERNCRNAVKQEDLRANMMDRACITPCSAHVPGKRVESFGKSDTLCKNVLTFHAFDGILVLARKEVPHTLMCTCVIACDDTFHK